MNELIVPFCSIFLAMIVIWRSSDGFQAASDYLGRNLTEGVRGATINAIGSSMPELFTTLFGLIMLGELDNFAFGMGTTSGSAIFNSMIIPAVVIMAVTLLGITNKVEVSKKVILRDGLGLIFCEFLLMYVIYKNEIDWLESYNPRLTKFILPGVTRDDSSSHMCRTQARKAERLMWVLQTDVTIDVPPIELAYINRLSDYFFVLARWICAIQGIKDVTM